MRAVLVGSAADRARLRGQLGQADVEVIAEFGSLEAANRSGIDADAFIVAPGASDPEAVDDELIEPLTHREIQVLELLAEGLPNKAIAVRLGISDQTVKFHVASIAGKLGAANRTDAVRRAVRRGLITL
jgi:DNA-binding NarL/FixJ family response regulator